MVDFKAEVAFHHRHDLATPPQDTRSSPRHGDLSYAAADLMTEASKPKGQEKNLTEKPANRLLDQRSLIVADEVPEQPALVLGPPMISVIGIVAEFKFIEDLTRRGYVMSDLGEVWESASCDRSATFVFTHEPAKMVTHEWVGPPFICPC